MKVAGRHLEHLELSVDSKGKGWFAVKVEGRCSRQPVSWTAGTFDRRARLSHQHAGRIKEAKREVQLGATRLPRKAPVGVVHGFTMIEMLIVVALVAILGAIALPIYTDQIRRGKIIEATSGLSDARQRAEQWFMDNRTYVGGCTAAVAAVQPAVRAFTLTCPAETISTYTIQADGNAADGMAGFQYTLNEANVKSTPSTPTGWGKSATCWTTRKDGSCS